MPTSSVRHRTVWIAIAFVLALLFDIATKWLIVNVVMVPPRTIELVSYFNLTLGFNTGVSFGMFSDIFFERPLLLATIKTVITIGLIVWAMRADRTLEATALGLIAGGAAGNILDRVWHGAVTDFLDFHIGTWHWPAFNMADVAITIGAALLIAGSIFSFEPARTPGPSSTEKR
ncbi:MULTISPECIES: signal peptidase II [Hyphomicrobiales]|uniref:Lipoprotein signal peptidase n=2 Tax=Shinella TaxID=323620 RepID=A0AA50CU88_9HYPH|nr:MULTISPECIES: signal peptidase II [Hyphomicrobiales]MCQ4634561.1 signal peptidase II [Shinella lacus]WLS01324.1 signal peptidase II [Shinella sumterensis]